MVEQMLGWPAFQLLAPPPATPTPAALAASQGVGEDRPEVLGWDALLPLPPLPLRMCVDLFREDVIALR